MENNPISSSFANASPTRKKPTSPWLWRDLGFEIRIHWCHKHRDQGAHILWKNWNKSFWPFFFESEGVKVRVPNHRTSIIQSSKPSLPTRSCRRQKRWPLQCLGQKVRRMCSILGQVQWLFQFTDFVTNDVSNDSSSLGVTTPKTTVGSLSFDPRAQH